MLADALPPAYELHRSGGEIAGKIKEEMYGKNREEIIASTNFPKECILLPDNITIWRPNIYKAQVNHYKRLLKAYKDEGIVGITRYLDGVRKIQEERRIEYANQQKIKQDGTKTEETLPNI